MLGESSFAADIDQLNVLEDREESQQVLSRAEQLMAEALGADRCFFSTGGSSTSVRTAVTALAGPGDEVIMSRASHKSAIEGLILAGANPVFVHPVWDAELEMANPAPPSDFEAALTTHPGARAAFVVAPTDYGVTCHIDQLVEVCHRHAVPLIADEAWGAHFPWHEELPQSAARAGADVTIHSLHKQGTALMQGSALILRNGLIDIGHVAQRMNLFASTSASTPIYASIDAWRRMMAVEGCAVLNQAMQSLHEARTKISLIRGLSLLERPGAPEPPPPIDPFKVIVDVAQTGQTGMQFMARLRSEHHLDVQLGDHRRIVAMVALGEDPAVLDRLVGALRVEGARSVEAGTSVEFPAPEEFRLELAMRPRDAYFAATEAVPIESAPGRVAAELVSPYPPGMPTLVPGERITKPVVDFLRSGAEAGFVVPDARDPELKTLRVVA